VLYLRKMFISMDWYIPMMILLLKRNCMLEVGGLLIFEGLIF